MGLLDELKKEAESIKESDQLKTKMFASNVSLIDARLRRTFQYLNDLFKQLNTIKPATDIIYKLSSIGEFKGLKQENFFIDYRNIKIQDTEKFETLNINLHRFSDDFLIYKAEMETMEKTRDLLWQYNIKFTSEVFRNDRSIASHEIFRIPAIVPVNLEILGDYEKGLIRIKSSNLENLGPNQVYLDPQSFEESALEELAKMIMGRPNSFKSFTTKSYNPFSVNNTTGAFQARPDLSSRAPISSNGNGAISGVINNGPSSNSPINPNSSNHDKVQPTYVNFDEKTKNQGFNVVKDNEDEKTKVGVISSLKGLAMKEISLGGLFKKKDDKGK